MALFGFGKKKEQSSKAPEVAPVEKAQEVKPMEKKEEPVIVPEEKIDPAVAEELFQKFESLANEDNMETFVYLQKAADLWHKEAVERVMGLYSSGVCMEFLFCPVVEEAAKQWKNPEKAVSYGLEAEKHGVDVAWELMYAYMAIENYEQAIHWAKISDSRTGKTEAVQRLTKEAEKWFEEALSSYKEKDYLNALALWEKAGRLDYAPAQFNCGVMYSNGDGTEVNKEKALYWYEKAAEQGHADAQTRCGIMYHTGDGTAKNLEKALYWYEKAAEQGIVEAQRECGIMYANGEGTAVDKTKALYWLEKAVGTPEKWEEEGKDILYEGYDAKLKEHIFGNSNFTTKKARLKNEFVILWDDSIAIGTPIKMKDIFRFNKFIITLIAKA